MKKAMLMILVLFSISMFASAAITDFTIDYINQTAAGGFTGDTSFGTYNYATGHFLICDYSNATVKTASGTDGSLLGALNTSGLSVDALGIFSICATSDGVIYGGANVTSTGGVGTSLIRWANESAAPVQQDPAPTAGNMVFPRAMDAIGTGINTIVASTGSGSSNYDVSIMTTTNGTTFAVTDYIADTIGVQFKQGVALVEGMEKIYGVKADGDGEVWRADKSGSVWAPNTSFTPPPNYTLPVPGPGLGAGCVLGYAKGHNVLFIIGNSNATDDFITALDGDTGAIIAQKQIGGNVATYGYGCVDLKETDGVGYFACRSSLPGRPLSGKISFTVYVAPTPTPTPSPTPIVLSVNSSWGLYE